jgi:hypothetical protein
MRLTTICAAILALAAGGACAQESPSPGSRLPAAGAGHTAGAGRTSAADHE